MQPTKNDITGDFLISGVATDSYRDGWERIFGKKEVQRETQKVPEKKDENVSSNP